MKYRKVYLNVSCLILLFILEKGNNFVSKPVGFHGQQNPFIKGLFLKVKNTASRRAYSFFQALTLQRRQKKLKKTILLIFSVYPFTYITLSEVDSALNKN